MDKFFYSISFFHLLYEQALFHSIHPFSFILSTLSLSFCPTSFSIVQPIFFHFVHIFLATSLCIFSLLLRHFYLFRYLCFSFSCQFLFSFFNQQHFHICHFQPRTKFRTSAISSKYTAPVC